jgi:hypothetical protein
MAKGRGKSGGTRNDNRKCGKAFKKKPRKQRKTGRTIGGYSPAGTSIVVGESGPEVITPAMPVNVSPTGQSSQPAQISFAPVFNTSAVDVAGFEALTQRYSRQLYDGLERELRARNQSLTNL